MGPEFGPQDRVGGHCRVQRLPQSVDVQRTNQPIGRAGAIGRLGETLGQQISLLIVQRQPADAFCRDGLRAFGRRRFLCLQNFVAGLRCRLPGAMTGDEGLQFGQGHTFPQRRRLAQRLLQCELHFKMAQRIAVQRRKAVTRPHVADARSTAEQTVKVDRCRHFPRRQSDRPGRQRG